MIPVPQNLQQPRRGRKREYHGWPKLGELMIRAGFDDDSVLAEKLGLSERTIQAWRLGTRSPRTWQMRRALADALNSTIGELEEVAS